MKNSKKIALMLAALISVGMFTGCGDNNTADEKSSISTEQSDSGKDLERGTVENSVYTNDYSGIKFTAPDGWEYASDEYISSTMNLGLEITENDNDLTKAMLEQTTVYDAMCIEQSTGKNIIIMYENLAKEVPNPNSFTAEDYLESVEKQFESVENVKFTKIGDDENITIGGEDYIKQTYQSEYAQMDFETTQIYYARKVGNYMLVIIASPGSTSDDMSVYEKNFE